MQLLKRPFEPRRYQEAIFATAVEKNALVVLPTGLGKTMVAIMLATHRLTQYPNSKVLILAPTKPLAQQHERSFREFLGLSDEQMVLFTGALRPEKRHAQWSAARVIFATPQGIENDVLSSKIDLSDVSLLVVDEAHRATGEYSYVFLAKRYMERAKHPRVLALTASPGTNVEDITQVCTNLAIEEIEVRSADDHDVKPYVQELDIEWVQVELPKELQEVRALLNAVLQSRIAQLRQLGVSLNAPHRSALLAVQGDIQGQIARGERGPEALKAASVAAEALKIAHAVELLDTQGVHALRAYFATIMEQAAKGLSKAVKNLIIDPSWKAARVKCDVLHEQNIEHPKLRELRKIVLRTMHAQPDAKMIIFSQYRDQGSKILSALEEINVGAKLFVGQAKKKETGMSQKEQRKILDEFSAGEFPCLIATSVAEEGLDIPKVDLVMFYEPVPSAIRTVQRRGRTGRGEKGRVIVLMTAGTVDVGYKWSAHHKEKRMYRAITDVKRSFHLQPKEQAQKTLLQQFRSERAAERVEQSAHTTIICDYREKASPVMKHLAASGVAIELKQLAVGDFQLSERVIIEYKRVPDFVDSLLDGRLLSQLKSLTQYTRPILLIEGEEDLYSVRNVRAEAIRGMLATIVVSYNIPLLQTKTPQESASLLLTIARREQVGGKQFQYHGAKPLTDDELAEYIVAAFPGIGSQLAKPLLQEFKSIKNIVNASEEELKKVALIGEKKAKRIRDVSERTYGKE